MCQVMQFVSLADAQDSIYRVRHDVTAILAVSKMMINNKCILQFTLVLGRNLPQLSAGTWVYSSASCSDKPMRPFSMAYRLDIE